VEEEDLAASREALCEKVVSYCALARGEM
jgi:hypothetical protein